MLTLTTRFKDFCHAHTYNYVQAVFRNVEILFFYIPVGRTDDWVSDCGKCFSDILAWISYISRWPLSWFRHNQSLLIPFNDVCLISGEEHIPILQSLVCPYQYSNPRWTTLEVSTLIITISMRFTDENWWYYFKIHL